MRIQLLTGVYWILTLRPQLFGDRQRINTAACYTYNYIKIISSMNILYNYYRNEINYNYTVAAAVVCLDPLYNKGKLIVFKHQSICFNNNI